MAWRRPNRVGFGFYALAVATLLVLLGWAGTLHGSPGPASPQADPLSARDPVPATFFAMHMHADALEGTPWPNVAFGGIRLWDTRTSWTHLNPSRGVYDWSRLDQWLSLAQTRKVDVLYTFGVTPTWAALNPKQDCEYHPGACSPPADLRDWEAFVRSLVVHANGRIRYWELWNEPNLSDFWSGDIAGMAQMAQRAYTVIKSVDPNAIVLTPAATASRPDFPSWLSSYFAAGGGNSADIIAFHGYPPPDQVEPERLKDVVASITSAMSRNGQTGKPIWDTEASWGTAPRLPDLDAEAAYVARAYVLQWSLGVQRFYWYAWNSPLWGTLWDGVTGETLKPGIAYGETYKWLAGAALTAPCSVSADATWTCSLTRPGGYEAKVVWNTQTTGNSKRALPLDPRFAQYRDLDGNVVAVSGSTVSIGSKPILLEPFTGITLSASRLRFDDTPVGTATAPQTLLMTNTGSAPVLLADVHATGDYASISECGDFIAVGGSCGISVAFQPRAQGIQTGTLLIHDNAPGAPHVVFLTNEKSESSILFSPSLLDFSGQVIGTGAVSKNVTVANVGDRTVVVSDPSIIDDGGGDFAVSATTCSSPLDPGGNCSITVTFSPKVPGVQSAVLRAMDGSSTGDPSTVPLAGAGWDFTLKLRDGSPPSAEQPGSGSYDIDVMPVGGFQGQVGLIVTCNLPRVISCGISPSSVDLSGATPVTVHVQVETLGPASLGLLLGVGIFTALGIRRRRPKLTLPVLALIFLAGCSAVVGTNTGGTSSPAGIVVTGVSRGGTRTLSLPVSQP